MERNAKVGALFVSCFFVVSGIGLPANASAIVEVAQSAPIETNLSVSGIRQVQQVWLEMIASAQRSIDLEEFYINSKPGEALEPVLNAVRAAASRGVQVRFVVDSKFYETYPNDASQLSQVSNIQVKTVDFNSQGGVQHSKYFVIDGSRAFLGSPNFDWLSLTHVHEVGLRVEDSQVASGLEAVFERDWAAGSSVGKSPVQGWNFPTLDFGRLISEVPGLQLVGSPPSDLPDGQANSLDAITGLLGAARSTVKIQMYEYTTRIYQSSGRWKALDTAVRAAASRGVRVQLLVDAVALKSGKADLKALAAVRNIEVRSVIIPQWSGGYIPYARLIHSKYLIADGADAWVGTENWSESYFTNSRNVGVTLQSAEVGGQLGQIFDRVWNSTYAQPVGK